VFSLAPWRTLLFWLLVPLVYCFIVFVIAVLPEHVDSRKLAFITGFFLVISFFGLSIKTAALLILAAGALFDSLYPFLSVLQVLPFSHTFSFMPTTNMFFGPSCLV